MTPRSPSVIVRRSPLLDASKRYWQWLGLTLSAWSRQLFAPKRRRSWIVFGGCFTWIFLLFFILIAYVMVFTLLVTVVGALASIGVLLSIAGGIDQARLNITHRPKARGPEAPSIKP